MVWNMVVSGNMWKYKPDHATPQLRIFEMALNSAKENFFTRPHLIHFTPSSSQTTSPTHLPSPCSSSHGSLGCSWHRSISLPQDLCTHSCFITWAHIPGHPQVSLLQVITQIVIFSGKPSTYMHTLSPFPGLFTSVAFTTTYFSYLVYCPSFPTAKLAPWEQGEFVLFTAVFPVPRKVWHIEGAWYIFCFFYWILATGRWNNKSNWFI